MNNKTYQKLRHYHGTFAVFFSIPIIIILITGVTLQFKDALLKRPIPTGSGINWQLNLQDLINQLPEETQSNDLKQIMLFPGKKVFSIKTKVGVYFLDAQDGKVLEVNTEKKWPIKSIHEGEYFGPIVRWGLFFPTAIIMIFLWMSGVYLYIWPIVRKKKSTAN